MEITMPCYSSTMPDLARVHDFILTVAEHVRCCNLEVILGEIFTQYSFFMVRKPNFLKENELGVFMLNKVSKIMFIPPESFYVERK